MSLLAVLKESLRLLRSEPKIYLPRIITTLVYTAFILYAAKLSLRVAGAISTIMGEAEARGAAPDFAALLRQFAGPLSVFLAFFLVAYALDIISYGMYARIVSDYHAGKPVGLIDALRAAAARWRVLVSLAFVLLLSIGGVFGLYFLLEASLLATGSALLSLLSLLVLIIGIVVLAIIFFFSIPVAMLEEKRVLNAIAASARLGFRHRGLVVKINLFFAGLILATLLVAMYTDFTGKTGIFAVAAFIAGRLIQTVIYTYMNVVNPELYIHIKSEHESV